MAWQPTSLSLAILVTGLSGLSTILWMRRKKFSKSSSAYEKLVGRTPLIRLDFLSEILQRNIYVKMEHLNPGGTGKDRAALCMIQEAETRGELPLPGTRKERVELRLAAGTSSSPPCKLDDKDLDAVISTVMRRSLTGGLVVEGTSGSTGISLATLCASRGHACLVVLPNDQAPEKQQILETLGAAVLEVKTASISNPNHYVNIARRITLLAKGRGISAVFINQFENLANFKTHYEITGPELWYQAGKIDAFCMSSGTGGTISGVAKCLKTKFNSKCRVVLVDPPGSSLYHAIQHGIAFAPQQRERAMKRHRYDTIAEGIGLDRLTANFLQGQKYVDTAIRVTDQEAVDMAHWLLKTEGLWIGSSSAMNLVGAVRTSLSLPLHSNIVTIVCDAGQRHVTRFWNSTFIREWGLHWPPDSEENERIPLCLQQFLPSGKKIIK